MFCNTRADCCFPTPPGLCTSCINLRLIAWPASFSLWHNYFNVNIPTHSCTGYGMSCRPQPERVQIGLWPAPGCLLLPWHCPACMHLTFGDPLQVVSEYRLSVQCALRSLPGVCREEPSFIISCNNSLATCKTIVEEVTCSIWSPLSGADWWPTRQVRAIGSVGFSARAISAKAAASCGLL